MMHKPHILVVDDDERLRQLLARYLAEHDFMITEAASAAEARATLAALKVDLMVLDVMMPHETGIEFATALRAENSVPILMLTAMSEPEDRISGLKAGVDDYLTKPFEPEELLLRIAAILRRTQETGGDAASPTPAAMLRFGPYHLEVASGRVWREGEPVHLTSTEMALLKALGETPNQPVSREALARAMSGNAIATAQSERSVDVQMSRLRKKLELDSSRSGATAHTLVASAYIMTIRNAGYALMVDG